MLRDRDPLPLPDEAREARGRQRAYRCSAALLLVAIGVGLVLRCAGC